MFKLKNNGQKISKQRGGNIISGVIVYKLIAIKKKKKKTKEIDKYTLFRKNSHRPENSDHSRSKISEQCLTYHVFTGRELIVLKLSSHTG